ncbi:phosphotransferase family protein [Bacillaceae bacterium Marseille-Q3522]|nr:phosphotransferase family protein [Bacillaceae bacterium Marseille-Q3522]
MEHFFGQDWEIFPAGGATGQAFFAEHEGQRLFLKRNSSPFLAVLSAEGIVPKLVWTKRMDNGDVITAQQCLEGRELTPVDMSNKRVARLLKKIHRSKPLLDMLKRLDKRILEPATLLDSLLEKTDFDSSRSIVKEALQFLKDHLPTIQSGERAVCHCDINHNNWLLSKDNQLYLIDWDSAMIADPAIDLGMLLYSYIPKHEWKSWLERYEIGLTEQLLLRMKWYAVAQTLHSIYGHKKEQQLLEMEKSYQFLEETLL